MKTTVELPDALLREAKSFAAQEGMTLKVLLSRALRDEIDLLSRKSGPEQPWRRHFGALQGLHDETLKIEHEIEELFGAVDDELWT